MRGPSWVGSTGDVHMSSGDPSLATCMARDPAAGVELLTRDSRDARVRDVIRGESSKRSQSPHWSGALPFYPLLSAHNTRCLSLLQITLIERKRKLKQVYRR